MWTQFMDMHSGGGTKQPPYEYIYIEAPEAEAKVIFYNRFGHNPERVSCTCCGDDYSISESENLAEATAYNRNCEYDEKAQKYVERQRASTMEIRQTCATESDNPWGLYMTVAQYRQSKGVLFIEAKDIKPEERKGEVPEQGYVYV